MLVKFIVKCDVAENGIMIYFGTSFEVPQEPLLQVVYCKWQMSRNSASQTGGVTVSPTHYPMIEPFLWMVSKVSFP